MRSHSSNAKNNTILKISQFVVVYLSSSDEKKGKQQFVIFAVIIIPFYFEFMIEFGHRESIFIRRRFEDLHCHGLFTGRHAEL